MHYKIESSMCLVKAVKLVVLFNHWLMPYKVERGRQSFQCGTTKMPKAPTGLALGLEAKNVLTVSIP